MKNKKLKIWSLYVVLLHAFLVIVLVKSDFMMKVGGALGVYQTPELSGYYNRIVEYHKRMDGNVQENSAIFIGDSITQGLAVSSVMAPSINYGIGSDTTLGVLNRLQHYQSMDSAKVIFLAIGINDLRRRSENEIVLNYTKIIERIRGNSLVVSAILPVDETYTDVKNEEIISLNDKLEKLASESKNIVFINAGNDLIDNFGNLKKGYHVGDGVHLSTSGYKIWIKALKQSISNMP